MFKKSLLIASVFGAGAVVSGIALADSGMSSTYCKPGFYAGVQAGWGQTNYNNEDVLSEVVTNLGNYTYNTYVPVSSAEINDTGISGRIFAGYQFNPYFAIEAGYTQFHKTDFSETFGEYSTSGSQAVSDPVATGYSERYDGEITQHATDVVAKITYPFNFYGFGVYGKVGAAFVAADRHINETRISSNGSAIPMETFYTKSYQAVRPTYGVGLDYTIPGTSLDVDVSWTEIAGGGGIPRSDLAALGASYKFA